MKIPGMIYYVVTVELFSGKFKLECVENTNKYLMNGYVSTFFEQFDPAPAQDKTVATFKNMESLEEKSEVQSEEAGVSENDENFSIEYTGEKTVSPPIRMSPGRMSAKSNDIPNVKPSPPVLSKKNSKAVFTIQKGKTFTIQNEKKSPLNSKLTSHEEFDDFFGNISDVVFCYNNETNGQEQLPSQKEVQNIPQKNDQLNLTTEDTVKYNIKNKNKLLASPKNKRANFEKPKMKKFFRKKIPKDLMGKTEAQIKKIINVPDIIFVNNNGNIACGFTLKSIIALAEYSLYN